MSDDRKFERNARAWLELGPTDAPDRVVEDALLEIESTSQERDLRLPWRLPTMNAPFRLAAAAVVGVLAVGGAFLLLRPTPQTGNSPSPTPTLVSPTSTPGHTGVVSLTQQYGALPGWILLEHFGNKLDGSVNDGDVTDRTLWLVKADGSQLHEMPRGDPTIWKISPDWSPDGTHIAFSSPGDPNPATIERVQLFEMGVDGASPQLLADTGCDPNKGCGEADPAYSPDGKQMAFVRLTGVGPSGTREPISGGSEIAIRDLTTGTVRTLASTQLSSTTTWAEQPAWSPDGSQIVFHRITMDVATKEGRPTGSELFIVGADDSGLHQLVVPGNLPAGDAAWSPDGARILFTSQSIHDWNDPFRQGGGDDSPSLYTIAPDGSGLASLSTGGSGTWSQDGSHILYFNQARIWLMLADGANAASLALGPSMTDQPTGYTYYAFWQPQP